MKEIPLLDELRAIRQRLAEDKEMQAAVLAFSPDGRPRLAAMTDGTVRYWEAPPAPPASSPPIK